MESDSYHLMLTAKWRQIRSEVAGCGLDTCISVPGSGRDFSVCIYVQTISGDHTAGVWNWSL